MPSSNEDFPINLGEGDARDTDWSLTGGINYYLSKDHRWKMQAQYSYEEAEDVTGSKEDTNILLLQLQSYF